MNVYLSEVLAGFQETVDLYKQGNNIFEMGNHAMFPNVQSQQKWRYARDDKNIRLSDGQNAYSFTAPEGVHHEQEFPLERTDGPGLHEFEQGATSKGLAQVHRADPGHIYFTIQEGKNNPTFTFRHVGENKWKGIPKVKKKKNVTEGVIPLHPEGQPGQHPSANPMAHTPGHNQPGMPGGSSLSHGGDGGLGGGLHDAMIPNANPEEVKMAFLKELEKNAGLVDGLNAGVHGGMTPGVDPAAAGLVGAAGGLGYHLLKKNSITLS